jgi:hypothetical protein
MFVRYLFVEVIFFFAVVVVVAAVENHVIASMQ